MNILKQLRKRTGLNQTELAREANVARTTVVMLEGNHAKAHQETLDKLESTLRRLLGNEMDVPHGILSPLKDNTAPERGQKGGLVASGQLPKQNRPDNDWRAA